MSASNGTYSSLTESLDRVGLGYGIAIAVGILVLVSTIMLASYVCIRLHCPSSPALEEVNFLRARGRRSRRRSTEPAMVPRRGDNIRAVSVVIGLDEATVESYPKFVFSSLEKQERCLADHSCSICLADYNDGDTLRLLPECRHAFHAACVDAWLRLHASCPMCRTSPLPTPVSTPLSESVPLGNRSLLNTRP